MTEQPRGGTDLVGEFQRWLVRSGARGVSREVGDQIKSAFGGGTGSADVWQTATSEPPTGHAADCAWCPVCRAARLLRESRPDLASHVAAAGGALVTLLQDAVTVAESALASTGRPGSTPGAGQAARPLAGSVEHPPHVPDDRG